MDEKILGEIPLRSWRWLGVNELKTSAQVEETFIDVADGETKNFSCVNLSDDDIARKIKISVGKTVVASALRHPILSQDNQCCKKLQGCSQPAERGG